MVIREGKMYLRKTIIFTMLAVLAVLPACLDEAVKPVKEAPPITWPDLSGEEDAIRTLVMCYDNPSLEGVMTIYENLLHSDYFFGLAPEDVVPGDPLILTRAEDIAITGVMFREQTILDLEIVASGLWHDLTEIGGSACTGCRTTTRQYLIQAQFGRNGDIYRSNFEDALVTIIVAPDESDASKWVIRAIYDHGT